MSLCRICGGDSKPFLDLGAQPFANKYPKNQKEIETEQKIEMVIEFCQECKSAQIANIIDRSLMFNDYYYLSSVNKELVDHFEKFSKEELRECKFVLDVGSNDGILLRPLKELGIKSLGIDPSINVGKLANDEGLETIIGFLDQDTASSVKSQHGTPDAIVASSVFTHIEEPALFVDTLKSISDENTSVYIEIEYLSNLIKNKQFERFYFDRPHYYSVHGMKVLFERAGFSLMSVKPIAPHGGSLRLKFKLSANPNLAEASVVEYLNQEQSFLSESEMKLFALSIQQEASKFIQMLEKLNAQGKTVIGYGAPARLATITNYCKINSDLISYIVEDSPLKIGRKTPGKHIPIVSSQDLEKLDFDIIIVFAYEYFNSIKEKTSKYSVPHYQPIPIRRLD
jgi:methylation protein EvaC